MDRKSINFSLRLPPDDDPRDWAAAIFVTPLLDAVVRLYLDQLENLGQALSSTAMKANLLGRASTMEYVESVLLDCGRIVIGINQGMAILRPEAGGGDYYEDADEPLRPVAWAIRLDTRAAERFAATIKTAVRNRRTILEGMDHGNSN